METSRMLAMNNTTGSFDPKTLMPFEGIDLTTAARQVSLARPELSRLAPGDLLDHDLCSAPLMDASDLSDMLSGDLSLLAL